MANPEHLDILKQGVEVWNRWREDNPYSVDLSEAVLPGKDLGQANLRGANLTRVDLFNARLQNANLCEANLSNSLLIDADLTNAHLDRAKLVCSNLGGANFTGASLRDVDLFRADLNKSTLIGAFLNGANLSGAYLNSAIFHGANFNGADLNNANLAFALLWKVDLSEVDLSDAKLYEADLRGSNLIGARLKRVNLKGADLRGANLSKANLIGADLDGSNLDGAEITSCILERTVVTNVDLSKAKGIPTVIHLGPSSIGIDTIYRSKGKIPESFLRGCGVPDSFIKAIPPLIEEAPLYYTCFISYSSANEDFAKQILSDLQAKGVRCWFAPEDLKWGAKTWDGIDEAIGKHDKLLLVLSENSIRSDWVEDEVTKGYAEERKRNSTVLFPIRIDDAVMETGEPWAVKLRDGRNIGDFRDWEKSEAYQKAFERLLRDLKAEEVPAGLGDR
jgi:uncharacterized protein YjbI with pentapeptide repeats